MIASITEKHVESAIKLVRDLQKSGFRCESDLRNEKIGYKIREHILSKIPYVVILGDKEVENNTISLRSYSGEEISGITTKELLEILNKN